MNFLSLIENAKSYTTSPKYAEWQTGINNSLPLLEEAFNKLRVLDIPTAEKDIIDPVRTAVNTPFMQVLPDDKAQLDEVSQIELGFPHDFLAQFRTGSIVNHRA